MTSGADRLTHFCFHCYARNASATGPCVRCGEPVEAPAGTTWEDLVVWALGHPVPDVAMAAATTAGALRVAAALPRLRELVASGDPYLAARALDSIVAIEGVERLEPELTELAEHGPIGLRRVARRALGLEP